MTAVRITRAIEAQRAGVAVAIARGDVAEEAARRRSLDNLERRERSAEALGQNTAENFASLLRHMDARDGLRRLIHRGDSGITFEHLRAAFALRDHMNGGAQCSCEVMERVDGGNIHNGQMEAMLDRRRPLRYALDAAREAVEDAKLMPVAIEIILNGRSPRAACDRCGVTWGGQMAPRICIAIVEALDAAAAHIGVAR